MDNNFIGVNSSPGSISPYMNFDPSQLFINSEPEFITLSGASHKRGRFELAFSQIGGAICTGAGIGSLSGLYAGLKETKQAQITGSVRRTQLLNSITKTGAGSAQSLGVIALLYGVFGVAISKARGADDELNTIVSASATGLLYKSTGGLKKSLRGGAIGFGLAAVYCLINSRDNVKKIIGM